MPWIDEVKKLYEKLGREPTLAELLEAARGYTMTPEEVDAQRLSWCIGELMLAHPEMTREEAISQCREALDGIKQAAGDGNR